MESRQPVTIITGGRQGIGRRTAETLAHRGFRVAIADLRFPAQTIETIEKDGGEAAGFVCDVAREADVQHLATSVWKLWGAIDVLVNNAGVSLISPAEQTSGEDFQRVLQINLIAPFLLSKAVGHYMLQAGRGSIVNVASIAGLAGVSDRSAYNASKHGLIGLTRTLAAEWGGRGVRVNAVCPGWVKTEMDVADQAGGSYSDADITARVPMGRFATPDDIANMVAFLADDVASAYVNGQAIAVDGGWTADASWESLRLRKR